MQELCVMLGVSRQTVHSWLCAGKAPQHERKGDRVYFDRRDAEQMKKARQQRTRRKTNGNTR